MEVPLARDKIGPEEEKADEAAECAFAITRMLLGELRRNLAQAICMQRARCRLRIALAGLAAQAVIGGVLGQGQEQ